MTHKFDSEAIRQAAAGRSGEFRIICLSCQGGSDHEECLCINADTGTYVCKRATCGIKGNFKHNTTEKKLKAAYIWEKSRIVPEHSYPTLKQIHPSIMRVDMFNNWLNDYRDQHGNIQTVQMVNPEKVPGKPDKYFLSKEKNSGVGYTGAAYRIEGDPDAYVCEGPATGHSIHEATGATVYCVGGCSNFKHVVPWVMQKHKKVVVCADAGNGEADARKVAQEYRLPFAVPGIPGTDFNDMAIDAGLDAVKKVLDNAKVPGPDADTTGPRFKLVKYSDIKMKPADWLVYQLFERDSLNLLFSDPGGAKTFLAIDVACCVATGKDFHGRFSYQGPIVYIAGEGQNGIARRYMAWGIRHGYDLDPAPLFLSLMPAGLCDADQVDFVIEAVQAVADEYGNPVLIVMDTVARNFGPGDENSTKDMTAFIAGVDKIREQFRSCILLVHHTGHADKSRGRGSMALKGALDTEYRLEKDETGVIRVTCTKMKDHESPPPMAFRLRTVELPFTDDQGNNVTSAILDDTEYRPPACQGKKGRGKWQTVSIEVLKRLFKEQQARLESKGYEPDQARVTLDDWRDACYAEGMNRETWRRLKDQLDENTDVFHENGYVTPSRHVSIETCDVT
jgi:hypothetical protein